MAAATKQNPDPNAKTDARKRQEKEALIKADADRQAAAEAEAQRKAQLAGGSGMVSQATTAPRVPPVAEKARFQEAQFKRAEFVLDASEGTRPEDLAAPGYWAHLGESLKPWSEVMVRANDGLWYARLIVLEAGRNWAKVHIEKVEYLTTAEVAITQADAMSPYEVTYRGPHNQWSVIRKSDRAVIHEGSQTMDAAVQYLKGRLQADR